MDPPSQSLSDQQVFLKEFILLYKQHPVLWDKNHPNYRNRLERNDAYSSLLKLYRQHVPEADEDYVKVRIDSMRSTFRKEHRKVLLSRTGDESESDYKPSLWYYDLLLFTVGQDCDDELEEKNIDCWKEETNESPITKIPYWSREYSCILLETYKKHPCLYNNKNANYKKKAKGNQAIKDIAKELLEKTGKEFKPEDVRRKLHLLRSQYMYELRKIKKHKEKGIEYESTLWCFEVMSFLRRYMDVEQKAVAKGNMKTRRMSTRKTEVKKLEVKKEYSSDSSINGDGLDANICEDSSDKSQVTSSNNIIEESVKNMAGDLYDTIGKVVAYRLRDMTKTQNSIAQRIIHDIMYHGQMENLTENSKLLLD